MSNKKERELLEEYGKVNGAAKALLSQWEYAFQTANDNLVGQEASTSRDLFYKTSAQFVRRVKIWKYKWPRLVSQNDDDKPELEEDGSSSSSSGDEDEEEKDDAPVQDDGVEVDGEPSPKGGKGKGKTDGPKKEKKPRKEYPVIIVSKLGAFNTLEPDVQHAYMGYAFVYALVNRICSAVNKNQISYANFFTSLVLNMGLVKSEVETIKQIGALLTAAIDRKKHKSVKKGMITYVGALVVPSSKEDRNTLHEAFKAKDLKTMLRLCPHLAIFEYPAELMYILYNLYNEKHNLLALADEYDYQWTTGKDGPEFLTSPPTHKSVFFDEVSVFKYARDEFPYEVSGDACTRDLAKLFPAEKIALIDRFLEEPNAKPDAVERIVASGGSGEVVVDESLTTTSPPHAPEQEPEPAAQVQQKVAETPAASATASSRKRAASTSNGSKKGSSKKPATTITSAATANSPPANNQATSPPLSVPTTPADVEWYTV